MAYKHEAHSWTTKKFMPWALCQHCGLVYLNNAFTLWFVRMGCNAGEHPEYRAARARLTK